MGEVDYEILAPKPHELPRMLDACLRVEAANWKGRNHSALLTDSGRRHFFEQYTTSASEKGILRMCFLKISRKPAATQIAVEAGGRFWLLKVGYDESFARCSPGNLLMLETLRYAASRGLRSYEFLGTSEPWTQIWTNRIRPCVSVRVYPGNARGAAALGSDALRFGWEWLSRQLAN
jgi:CelD/BcsL family acetyltransferase involved in cellulose biosynthesis